MEFKCAVHQFGVSGIVFDKQNVGRRCIHHVPEATYLGLHLSPSTGTAAGETIDFWILIDVAIGRWKAIEFIAGENMAIPYLP